MFNPIHLESWILSNLMFARSYILYPTYQLCTKNLQKIPSDVWRPIDHATESIRLFSTTGTLKYQWFFVISYLHYILSGLRLAHIEC